MAATKEQTEEFVRDQYPHGVESGLEERGGRIFGFVRSRDIEDDDAERVRAFRRDLDRRFGQQTLDVGFIVPLRPEEPINWR